MKLYVAIEEKLNETLCGYRKGKSTKGALLSLIESWKNTDTDDLFYTVENTTRDTTPKI